MSAEQLAEARDRAVAEGLDDRVTFELRDYRAVDQTFDRIVSVGMFEHVGVGFYQTFLDTVARSLNPDGVALLHSIGRSGGPGATNAWIDKYIFPGGYSPPLSEVLPAVERSGPLSRPTSKSCGCTTRKLCDTGGGVLPPTATRSRRFTTNGSAACSNFICARRSWRFAAAATW